MSFIDFRFYPCVICLCGGVALLQYLLKTKKTLSQTITKSLLLAFSYLVMWLYDIRFCLCLTGVILFVYFAGRAIAQASGKSRHTITVFTVTTLLTVLGIFKYLNFFLSTAFSLAGKSWSNLTIILPLGISFYILSAIGYVLDVSWQNIPAEQSLLDMALFLAFFPKQVCGPIVNARDFLPQLKENRRITRKSLETGVQIFLFGFFKKFVLANHLALLVDDVYAAPVAYGTATVWLAVFSYYLQLYFDFSGYSDMAVGVSTVFGYDLGHNFNLPFIAPNISGFWDRWHISLTSWLNVYIFNPIALKLKRSVVKWPKKYREAFKNLPNYTAVMLTFLISSLWHGVGFTFIVWGFLHALFLVLHRLYAGWVKKHHRDLVQNKRKSVMVLDVTANYVLINLIQVFFRASSVSQAFFILRRMFTVNAGIEQPYTWSFIAAAVLLTATLAACRRAKKQGLDEVEGYYPLADLRTFRGLTAFFTACGLTILFSYFGEAYFIYGRF